MNTPLISTRRHDEVIFIKELLRRDFRSFARKLRRYRNVNLMVQEFLKNLRRTFTVSRQIFDPGNNFGHQKRRHAKPERIGKTDPQIHFRRIQHRTDLSRKVVEILNNRLHPGFKHPACRR